MKENKITKLSEREHALKRPSMWIGSVKNEESSQFIYEKGTIEKQKVTYTPGLLKIVNEIIDNTIDEGVRTDFKYSNVVKITLDKDYFSVEDNGRGIPQNKVTIPETGETLLSPVLAWTHLRAGSNFEDNSNTIGANGAGSALTNFFSSKFIGITSDGKNEISVICENNAESVKTEVKKARYNGTKVTAYPDFKRLDEKNFTEDYFKLIETRLYILAVSYPKIKFYFNEKLITADLNTFINLFDYDKEITIEKTDKYSLAFIPSKTDDFEQFTIMNGLLLNNGGSCVDFIINGVSNALKEKLSKKYPNIKPADIKNKIFLVSILKDFIDPKYDSPTREKLTNSQKEVSSYFNIDIQNLANKIFKNKEIMDNITDYFRVKKKKKKRQELKALEKTPKKIKSEKYTPPIGNNEYLFLCEGFSAVSALQVCLGRQGKGYFELKGKVMNVSDNKKALTDNKELKELYQIIKSTFIISKMYEINLDEVKYYARENDTILHKNKEIEVSKLLSKGSVKEVKETPEILKNYRDNENVIKGGSKLTISSDNDVDGLHISALLLNFFNAYIPEAFERLYKINTPIAISTKNGKVIDWCYNLQKINDLKGEVKYMKGLGSWTKNTLSQVIEKDGFENMLMKFQYDENSSEALKDWFEGSRSDIRKEKIRNNDFSLIKI